ncbi:M20 family metallopeptidase [Clostridium drakei]|uniref:M20 family metallopeptidase n=1 Tax=Clostridium drakei TaxID=332101 RepID=UPI0005098DA5|nr:M20 family metallopeptidase [Clostridium drakei]
MEEYHRISEIIESKRQLLINISDEIWRYAELKFQEFKSAELLCKTLEKEEFSVQRGAAGIKTAFVASYGKGKPVIAILGEYDALDGLSQEGGVTEEKSIIPGGSGHGCGHNLLGTGALGAAIALRYCIRENNLPGTIRYYGCPAEEGGCGKVFMTREGLFNDVDCALSWHPDTGNYVGTNSCLALYNVYFKFKGKSSHAAMVPHLGRSALDAVELMNVGVNYLREHIIPEARIHYAITNAGGSAPNIVQAEAEDYFSIRAPKISQARGIYERACDVAKGAALMTGTKVEISIDSALSNFVPNKTLEMLIYKSFSKLGTPEYSENDRQLAKKFRTSLSEDNKKSDIHVLTVKELRDKDISEIVNPFNDNEKTLPVSTDVGDVSWIVPTGMFNTACAVLGTPIHSWIFVAQGNTSIAHKGMLQAGKVIALTAVELFKNPEIIQNAKRELKERLGGETYSCPIPKKNQ